MNQNCDIIFKDREMQIKLIDATEFGACALIKQLASTIAYIYLH
jgi:hypothetical protein